MMVDARLSHDGRTLTVRVPMVFAKRGGRKSVISADGVSTALSLRPRVDSTLIKALARAFRWRRLLETGVYATIDEMAAAEKINASYVSRVLRLTLLAPYIVEAILDGRQPAERTLAVLVKPFATGWWEQFMMCGRSTGLEDGGGASPVGKAVTVQADTSAPIDSGRRG